MNTFLRKAEYYGMLEIFDNLYKRSREDKLKGVDLLSLITSRNNILLAYRTIKGNMGSKTMGTDGLTIEDYKIVDRDKFVEGIQKCFENYKPSAVRRVEIPKSNGKKRPLGIPTMQDRLIQQCIKQILEPICEAKFYNHSYGFRPNRSTHDAIARCQYLVNRTNLHHVVDVDIKGFFDSVNHTKLLKQLYNIGVKDKRVLTIINKILKAPIKGVGIPNKGTPQGGILSPLLSNVVLNELDRWIVSQWESIPTRKEYNFPGNRLHDLKKTHLKRMYIVRYADDFKVFTDSHQTAIKIYHAIKGFLKDRLQLDISPEKSKVTNIRKKKTLFLGFALRAEIKRKKYVAQTYIADEKKEDIVKIIRKKIKQITKQTNPRTVLAYNSYVMGIQNYFIPATQVNQEFAQIAYRTNKTIYNRLKSIGRYGIPINPNEMYKNRYKNNYRTMNIGGCYLVPISDVKHKTHMNFKQGKCNYTIEGRKLIEASYLDYVIKQEIINLQNSVSEYTSIEYADNRISKYSMQMGKCAVTNEFLTADNVHCHHIVPKHMQGTDVFSNLVVVSKEIHKLIHATHPQTIGRYKKRLKLNEKQLKKINIYRKKCNLEVI